jgi:hypothetical protein
VAAGMPWQFGPERAAAVPRVEVDTTLLQSLVPMPPVSAAALVADLAVLRSLAR